MAATHVFGILPLLLFFGGFSLPLGLPPLPEDPVINRVAPAECLAYASWAGTAKPDAKSKNQTEQLLAEPEIQKLIGAIDNAIATGIDRGAQRGAHDAAVVKDLYPLAKTILTRPTAIFLSKLDVTLQGPPNVQAGAVVSLAEKATAVSETLDRLEKILPPGMASKLEIADSTFHSIQAGPMPPVVWGIRKDYLFVGIGDGVVEGILKRTETEPPAWLAAVRKQLPVDRQSTFVYFNVKQAVSQFVPLGGLKLKVVIDAIGLDNVSYLASVTGLDSKGTVARTLFAIDGEPHGIFHLAGGSPLTAADLDPIPADATLAAAGRCDTQEALELFLAQVAKVDSNAPLEIKRGIRQMEQAIGIDLRADLLKPLGDVWCLYNSPGEGGLLVTGLTGVVQVRDHVRLEATLNKLITLVQAHGEQSEGAQSHSPGTPRIVKTTFGGQTIYHMDVPQRDFFLAPAWCLTEKELIVSTFPQNIKARLSRGKDFLSLATAPDVARAIKQGDAIAVTYGDTRKIAEFAYPLVCVGAQLICSQLNREGIPLDSSLIPSAAAIFPHLQPTVGIVRRSSAGIESESHGPLAGNGVGPMLPLPMFLFVARSQAQVAVARQEAVAASSAMGARRAMSINNLKQIALAALNYAEANGAYPAAFIADKTTGKPLLSWRVAILPYVEQDALYNQFHLDEPWDSDNNKKLIARMPTLYRSSNGATAPGKTRYLTVRSKDGVFPSKDGVRLADVPDGLSNTLLVVEADESHAVTWTRPDDLPFDPKKPGTGLTGQPSRGFNAVFCDGAARFIPDTVGAEALCSLVDRHDGHMVKLP
jgi:hypothetical protein